MAERTAEGRPGRIAPVVDQLKRIPHDVVKPLLDARLSDAQALDPKAGIVLVSLEEAPLVIGDLTFHFHGARVLKGEHNYVHPHYHKIGEEPYAILTASNAEMNLGRVEDSKVVWQEPRTVEAGAIITVQEGEVHSLRNLGEEPLDFIFACPDAHLEDNSSENPKGDRYFTMELEDGVPPAYLK